MLTQKGEEMSRGGGGPKAEKGELFVAVAVKGIIGDKLGGAGSRRAVRWAVDNLLPKADRFVMIHVIPTISTIPTPSKSLNQHISHISCFVPFHFST